MSDFFFITNVLGTLALQAGSQAGDLITVQKWDPAHPGQIWTLRGDNVDGVTGVVFVNPSSGLAAVYTGIAGSPIIMKDYVQGSDALTLCYIGSGVFDTGGVMITPVTNANVCWMDITANVQPGDVIVTGDATNTGLADWTFTPQMKK